MSIKELSKTFEGVLDCLIALAEQNAKGLRGNDATVMDAVNQEGIDNPGPDPKDPQTYNEVFDRSSLREDYEEARKFDPDGESGTVIEVELVMQQHEFLAGAQRDFMTRRMSRLQASAAMATRMEDLGDEDVSPFEIGLRKDLRLKLSSAGEAR